MRTILEYSEFNGNFLNKYETYLNYDLEKENLEGYNDSEIKVAKSYFNKCTVRPFFIGQIDHLMSLGSFKSIIINIFKLIDCYYVVSIQILNNDSIDDYNCIWVKLDQRDQFKEFISSLKKVISEKGENGLIDCVRDTIKKLDVI